MALARYNLVIQDENGNIVNGATVSVVDEATALPATVYSDRAGSSSLGSSFVAADGSDAGFHAVGGSYKITVTHGSFSKTFRYVGIGLASETDGPPAVVLVVTVGTTVVNSGNNKILYDNNGVAGSGIAVIPTAFTRTALQAAVTAVVNAGGGVVQLLDGDYVFANGDSPITIGSSNVRIQGTSKSRILAPTDSTSVSGLITWSSSASNSTTISANVTLGARSITLASATGYATGDWIKITSTTPQGYFFTLTSKVTNVAGSVISLADPMPFPVNVTTSPVDTTAVVELVPKENIQLDSIQFVGTSNTGTTRAVFAIGGVQCSFTNLSAIDFIGAAAYYIDTGYGNVVDSISARKSGTSSESDITFHSQTAAQINKVASYQAAGFGPQFLGCSYIQVGSVASHKSVGRGIKLFSTVFSTFGSLIGNDSGSTGVAITLGSSYNLIDSVVAMSNIDGSGVSNAIGLWFSGQDNKYNQVGKVVAYLNSTYDISLNATDNNNILNSLIYKTINDGGTTNSKVTTKVLP